MSISGIYTGADDGAPSRNEIAAARIEAFATLTRVWQEVTGHAEHKAAAVHMQALQALELALTEIVTGMTATGVQTGGTPANIALVVQEHSTAIRSFKIPEVSRDFCPECPHCNYDGED